MIEWLLLPLFTLDWGLLLLLGTFDPVVFAPPLVELESLPLAVPTLFLARAVSFSLEFSTKRLY